MLKVHGRAVCVCMCVCGSEAGKEAFCLFDAYSCGTPKVLGRKVSFGCLTLDSRSKSSEKEPLASQFSSWFKLSVRGS